MRYRLTSRAGHRARSGDHLYEYKKGDVLESDADLTVKFPNKFERVAADEPVSEGRKLEEIGTTPAGQQPRDEGGPPPLNAPEQPGEQPQGGQQTQPQGGQQTQPQGQQTQPQGGQGGQQTQTHGGQGGQQTQHKSAADMIREAQQGK